MRSVINLIIAFCFLRKRKAGFESALCNNIFHGISFFSFVSIRRIIIFSKTYITPKFTSFYHKSSIFIGHCRSYYPLIVTSEINQ